MSRYRCVDAQKVAGFPVVAACDAAGVSAYHAWTASAQRAAERHRKEVRLVREVRRIHARSHGTYGAPRVTVELRRRGQAVNHKRVERLMRQHGIVGYRPRSLTRQDRAAPPAPDLLGWLFDPDQVDLAWCGDSTYIPTDEGWLYLASVLDLASRHLLGWSMSSHHDTRLVTGALDAAVATRGGQRLDGTIFHSDRGAEYNRTRAEAHAAIFAWIGWYNRFRLHSSRGYLPPIEWEQQHATISPLPSTTAA